MEARTISSVGSSTVGGASGSSRSRTASEPLPSWGWRTVVSAGVTSAASAMSS